MRVQTWPFEWFFDGKHNFINNNFYEDIDDEIINGRIHWRQLEELGWRFKDLESLEYFDYVHLPQNPGIYVVIHEHETPALYVGQSTNIKRRVSNRAHHKISEVISLFETAPFGRHNKGNAKSEILIYWKELPPSCRDENINRWLVWCESIAIGFLCPLMQGATLDIIEKNWALGEGLYS